MCANLAFLTLTWCKTRLLIDLCMCHWEPCIPFASSPVAHTRRCTSFIEQVSNFGQGGASASLLYNFTLMSQHTGPDHILSMRCTSVVFNKNFESDYLIILKPFLGHILGLKHYLESRTRLHLIQTLVYSHLHYIGQSTEQSIKVTELLPMWKEHKEDLYLENNVKAIFNVFLLIVLYILFNEDFAVR